MSSTSVPKWDANSFWSSRDYQTSARLHLQHWIWNYQLGWSTLHPQIDVSGSKTLKVADIGAGNGAWLLELATNKPDAELVGFDLTTAHYPHQNFLPSNMRLLQWDAFSTLPAEHEGVYDIVHIRTLNSAVVDNKVDPLLSNALAMLKPGGYIQWEENDASKLTCEAGDSNVSTESTDQMVRLQTVMLRGHSKILPDWLYSLPETLRERGCEVVATEVTDAKKELARATTDNYLLVWQDTVRWVPEAPVPLPPNMGLPESLSRQTFVDLLEKSIEETSKGARVSMPFHVVVARKGS